MRGGQTPKDPPSRTGQGRFQPRHSPRPIIGPEANSYSDAAAATSMVTPGPMVELSEIFLT